MKKFKILFLFILLSANVFGQKKKKVVDTVCVITFPLFVQANGADKLLPKLECPVKTFDFVLYDKFGKLMYHTDTLTFPLDFNIYEIIVENSKPKYPSGRYYWTAVYELTDGVKKTKKGFVTLYSVD